MLSALEIVVGKGSEILSCTFHHTKSGRITHTDQDFPTDTKGNQLIGLTGLTSSSTTWVGNTTVIDVKDYMGNRFSVVVDGPIEMRLS